MSRPQLRFPLFFDKVPGINLNLGSVSRCPKSVMKSFCREVDLYEQNPTQALFNAWAGLWPVQKAWARFFYANPKNFFLRTNVTAAMNDILLGVRLPLKGSIVVSDLEYGAIVNICELRAQREGRRVHTLHIKTGADAYSSPEQLAEDVLRQIPSDAVLVMLSHVITGTGLVLPIEQIGKRLREKGVLLAVDGAHGPGGLKLDFRKLSHVDFYGGNGHKWFMGPKGTGFGWASDSARALLQPIAGSWTTSANIYPQFQVFGDGDRFALQMLQSHTHNFATFYALTAALDFWNKQGERKILNELRDLQLYAIDAVAEELGWKMISPQNAALRGPLVSFELPPELQAKGMSFMKELWDKHKVQVATPMILGVPVLRLSPHICTSRSEISKGVREIKKYWERVRR